MFYVAYLFPLFLEIIKYNKKTHTVPPSCYVIYSELSQKAAHAVYDQHLFPVLGSEVRDGDRFSDQELSH